MLFSACSSEEGPPADVLGPERMAEVLIDTEIADALYSQKTVISLDSVNANKESYYKGILEKHNLSRDEFERSFGWYRSNPDKMTEVYEMVLDSLTRLEVQVEKEIDADARKKAAADTISPGSRKKEQNKPATPPQE